MTGPELVTVFVRQHPETLAEVPGALWRELAEIVDRALLDARVAGNHPRRPLVGL